YSAWDTSLSILF
nr:immunoglobulin light chain junction region [Macaca mulatta]